ncbi:MAG: metallophosphoesterase [Anaerovibrio sp.]|uniref:metallophosphoesterase family protein n=1 Tax=Anaerovibrio sp. TaxID=1872532 RepID=UPI0025F0A0F9|nr:metallophosphoesterase [Anaerovibrio sp.]MCR5175370.1 metallophosphoesterase [Anaerovibrio sp.]
MFCSAGLITADYILRPFKSFASGNLKSDPYHILLLSDLHLPWKPNKYTTLADQQQVWESKQSMLSNINSWNDVDEAAILGDLAARYGNEDEFACVDDFLDNLRMPWYAIAGNHDYVYRDTPDAQGNLQIGTHDEKIAKLAAFNKRYHLPAMYYGRSIGKYRLLYLAPDACGDLKIELSAQQLDWLKKEISAHQHGPIIFLCHAPLMGTLQTYKKKINTPHTTAQPADKLQEILNNCPEGSLWVSGHTHTPPKNNSFADDRINRFNKNLVNIHNPAVDKKHIYTNSLYLYEHKIVVRTYDHRDNAWVKKFDRVYNN